MRTIIVDNDAESRSLCQFYAENMDGFKTVQSFDNSWEALQYAQDNKVELAILGMQLSGMNGIELGSRLRSLYPNLLIIYISTAEEYVMDALKLKTVTYLLKPLNEDELLYGLESAKLLLKRNKKRVYARTFGYFDLFVDGKPVMFKSSKAKELLALMIDRCGGTLTTDQIISVLWEERVNDEATQSLCSKVVKALSKELDDYGVGDILLRERGIRSIDTTKMDCDLYDFLDGRPEARRKFLGDYMLEYSWAEGHMNALWKREEAEMLARYAYRRDILSAI